VLERLRSWHDEGLSFGLATVIGVRGSAPRSPGAVMAVNGAGDVVGSVSGGCVEGAVYEAATEVLRTGESRTEKYGISNDDAFAVGLTCGGIIELLVQRVDPSSNTGELFTSLAAEDPVAVAAVVAGDAPTGARLIVWPGRVAGSLGNDGLDAAVADDARGLLAQGATGVQHYGPRGQRRMDAVSVFVQSFSPRPRMLVFGAIDYAAALAEMGAFMGYRVTVCDARPVFATHKRFPKAHEVVCDWPHRYLAATPVPETTAICVLTHDPKFDVPLLKQALETPARYIGVMGSRRTHDDRIARLRDEGVADAQLARLRSPVGLDLGARTPPETAVSIAAEIIVGHSDGSGRPLGELSGPIHHHDPGDALRAVPVAADGAIRP
ncbi:MAG: XdhC family protein, partial [Thermocrispum sp.]